jgi:branched-chain amino acid transport system substrate-binding protein
MAKKRLLILCLVLLVMSLMTVLALAGCGSSSDETTTTAAPAATTTTAAATTDTTVAATTDTTTAAAAFDGELVLGAMASLTGGGAMGGAEQKWAYDKAVSDINAKGGVNVGGKHMKLVLKYADDKSDPVEAAAAVEKLVKIEGLKIILGTQVHPLQLAAAVVAEKYQAFYCTTVAWRSLWEQQNFKWASMHFFSPDEVARVPFQMVAMQPEADRPTKWGVLTEDNSDGQGLGEGVKAVAAEFPWAEIASFQTYTPGTKDYSSIILKMKQAKVDAVVTLISPADGITFTKQMKEQNFSPKYMMGWKGFWPSEYQTGLGADSNFVCYDAFWSEDMPFEGAKQLGEEYKADNNGLESVSIGLFYANVQVMAAAIERAGSADAAAVRDQVYGGSFKGTVIGDITYNDKGTAPLQPTGNQWMDGKRVIIYPKEVASGTMQWFKPWDQR